MKFKVKEKSYPKDKDRRIIDRFAFLPVRAYTEIRFLERVTIQQEFSALRNKWVDLYFISFSDSERK